MANFYCAFFHLMCKIPFWPCFFQILGAASWIKIPWVYARIRAPVQLLSFARLSLTCHPCVEFFFFFFFFSPAMPTRVLVTVKNAKQPYVLIFHLVKPASSM